MRKFRTLVAIGLVISMISGLHVPAMATEADPYATLLEECSDIEPISERTTIRYIGSVGLQLSAPIWISYKAGLLDKLGIDLEFISSASGPISIEALAAGEVDLVGTGIGGIAVGAIQGIAKSLCYINNDVVGQKFYVKSDNDLASAEDNGEGFKGTADDWKGREVAMGPGTTLQYLMGYSLAKIGLTLDDINPVYMSTDNVNTAMYAGQGEVWGIWNYLCYSAKLAENGFVPVIEGGNSGIVLTTEYATTEEIWADPVKREALEAILKCHFKVLDWMNESEENKKQLVQEMTDWCNNEGTPIEYDEMYSYIDETYYYSYEENMEYYGESVTNDYGTMPKALDLVQGIMDFYVEQGNYTEDDRAAMIENGDLLFNVDALASVQ